MSSGLFEPQLQYIRSVFERCATELSPTLKTFLEELLSFAELQNSFVLNKADLLAALEKSSGSISNDNFKKRISQLNSVLEDGESPTGIKFENSKTTLSILFDEVAVVQFIDEQTVSSIQRVNASGAPDTAHIVESTASNLMAGSAPQVMFSYCWGGQQKLLERKREFAHRLAEALRNPPAKYKDEPKITLFLDINGFEIGENQQNQQDVACEQSGAVVVPYCDGYLHSTPCQREIGYFLTAQGENIPGKKAIVAPFITSISNADGRYKNNLAAVPNQHKTVLQLLESGKESDIAEYIEKIVCTLYEHFRLKKKLLPTSSEHEYVRQRLVDLAKLNAKLANTEDPLAAQGTQLGHQYGIKIVPFLADWALSTAPESTRLFYLLGDFGAGKSTTCQLLTNQLTIKYDEAKRAGDTEAVLPIYLDLKKLLNAFNDVEKSLDAPVEKLLETMLSVTGGQSVDGSKVIDFIHKQPALLIFDGFDEVGQKLNESQQVGLLKKIVEIFPNKVYQHDLKRLQGKNDEPEVNVPHRSRILITCRTHFFSSVEKEAAFRHLYYRHDAGERAGDIANFQTYYLLPFNKEQINSYLVKWLGEQEGQKAVQFIERVHDLSGLSERPVMLQFIRQLIPDLVREAEHNQNINAATLYYKLFQRAMNRDAEKHWIDTNEKFLLLARFAVYMWQQKTNQLNQQLLIEWFKQNYMLFTQMSVDIQQGRAGINDLLQDLFNACLLVRDSEDNYRFAHTSFYEFFLACGLFELVRAASADDGRGFDIFSAEDTNQELMLNHETKQFLIDWRLTTSPQHVKQFDTQWQCLQQQKCTLNNKKIAFEIWYLAYQTHQHFIAPKSPNWSGLNLQGVDFEHALNLHGADFGDCLISQSVWRHINLSNSRFAGARIMQSHFTNCIFDGVEMMPLSLQFSRFWQCRKAERLAVHALNLSSSNFIMPTQSIEKAEDFQLRLPTVFNGSNSVCYSPDGNALAIAGDDKKVRTVDLGSGEVRELATADGGIQSLCYHPNGSSLAYAGNDGKVRTVDLVSGEMRELATTDGVILSLSYHPDGSALAFAGDDRTVRTVDLFSNEMLELAMTDDWIRSLCYHPNGKALAFAGDDEKVQTIDLLSGQVRELAVADGWIRSLCYHPDGSALAFAGDDLKVRTVDLDSGEVRELAEADGGIHSLCYNPDGRALAFLDGHQSVLTVDLVSGEICEVAVAEDRIQSLCYHPDGSALAFAEFGRKVRNIDLVSGEVRELTEADDWMQCLCYHPNGCALAFAGNDRTVRTVDLVSGEVRVLAEADGGILSLCYHPDGGALAFAGNDRKVRTVDLVSGEVRELAEAERGILSLCYNPGGFALTFAGVDQNVRTIDLVSGEVRELVVVDDWIHCLCYHPDGSALAFAGDDRTVRIVDLGSGEVRELAQADGGIYSLCYHPDGRSLAFAGSDGKVRTVDLVTGEVRELAMADDWIRSLCYNPAGSMLAFAGDDRKVWTVDLISGEVREVAASDGWILSLCYLSSGAMLAFVDRHGLHLQKENQYVRILIRENSYFVFSNDVLVKAGGEAWRYLTSVKADTTSSYLVNAPTSHPDWPKLQNDFRILN